jgi:hypothetical protein
MVETAQILEAAEVHLATDPGILELVVQEEKEE